MKIIAVAVLYFIMYRIYRLFFSKKKDTGATRNETSPADVVDGYEAVVKIRYVLPAPGQPQTTRTRDSKSGFQEEKPPIFAAGNENKDAVIPPERMDKAFLEEVNPEDLDIDEDEETNDEVDLNEEEDEELRQTMDRDTDVELAGGLSIDEILAVPAAVDKPAYENAGLLNKVEKTDMFEELVSGNVEKVELIRVLIDRYLDDLYPDIQNKEIENTHNNEWRNFEMSDYLSLS